MREAIMEEVKQCFMSVDDEQIQFLVDKICRSPHIIVHGKGRVGIMLKAFAMRLSHLGLYARVIGDITTPPIREGDLLLIGSVSGYPSSSTTFFEIARKNKAYSIAFTAYPDGQVGTLADSLVVIHGRTMNSGPNLPSLQPMCSTVEQTLLLLLDYAVLLLQQRLGQDEQMLRSRHANIL